MRIRFALLSFFFFATSVFASGEDVRFEQKLGTALSPQTQVMSEQGAVRPLGDYFGTKPIILSFVYYGCPNLCTLVLNGLATSIQESGIQPGRDVELLSVSIDPNERPSLSLAKKRTYLARLGQTGDDNPAWHFLTATPNAIDSLTQASGFHYKYDPISRQFNHPSGIIVLSPKGVISRYFFGIRFNSIELKTALNEATLGKSHRTLSEVILNCFHYDPQTGKYGSLIISLLQGFSLFTVFLLGVLFLRLSLQPKEGRP